MNSLKEQIENRCIHFTGIQNKRCKKNILYADVLDKSTKPYKFPCLLRTHLQGGCCKQLKLPTEQQVIDELKMIEDLSKPSVLLLVACKDKFKRTGKHTDKINCPTCNTECTFVVAPFNHHVHTQCEKCDITIKE